MLKKRAFQALALGLFACFVSVEFLGAFSLAAISPYSLYLFEICFFILVSLLYRPLNWKTKSLTFGFVVSLCFALTSGFAVFEFTSVLGYTLPFQMKDPETVLFLLLLGPILEELVFRSAIWRIGSELFQSPLVPFFLSSVLFSYSHYQAIQNTPEVLHGFIRYQGIYSLGLGLFCSGMRLQFGLIGAILTHLSFNLGFFLGSV
jgi:hypothetical protein